MSKILTFCKNAQNQLKNILKQSNKKYIFIGLENGGCNGLKYILNCLATLVKICLIFIFLQ